MNCMNCGAFLTDRDLDYCPNCGYNVLIHKKVDYLSKVFYNQGLEKASIRDLSGAIACLKQSLMYDKRNIQARNLLGLVYFETGEVVSALSEWVISKNLQPTRNQASEYINKLQANPNKLAAINETIKKYNHALLLWTEQGRLKIDYIKMKIPLFGKLTVKSACAQFARTMSTLMAAGISTTECLDTVSKIINNIHYKNAMQKAKEEVMKGIPLSEPLAASEVFPPMVYHMTGIGEETGNMEEMLNKLADYYDEEVEITTQSVLAAMEPLIIVFMALIVGTLVIAVLMPMRTMYDGLGSL